MGDFVLGGFGPMGDFFSAGEKYPVRFYPGGFSPRALLYRSWSV